MWDERYNKKLAVDRETAAQAGGISRIEKQHSNGKLSARERLEILFDEGSFIEVGGFIKSFCTDFGMENKQFLGDGVITGYGTVNGRTVFASSQDFTIIGGTLGEHHSKKICHVMDMAIEKKCPFITINDSGGARIEEGIHSLAGYSSIFYRNTMASGVIPQISVIMGPCAGGACYSPAITDFIFMTKESSKMFITGPGVIKEVTGEDITVAELGGADVHSRISGVSHFVYEDDVKCLEGVKELLKYLPQNSDELSKPTDSIEKKEIINLEDLVPDNQKRAYDVKKVIKEIIDDNSFFEVQENFAQNIVIGFGRIEGKVVGLVANQPLYMSGCLDVNASDKAARFVRFCDCFNIPLITLVDVPGFLPGKDQEHKGIIRHGAKLLYAYSEATVPKICIILRKAYGGAYIAMNSKNTGADIVFAWPIAQLAVMGAEGAVNIIHKNELKNAENPQNKRDELIEIYNNQFMNPYISAERGYVDEIIFPNETRQRIIISLNAFKDKKSINAINKKHGNMPL